MGGRKPCYVVVQSYDPASDPVHAVQSRRCASKASNPAGAPAVTGSRLGAGLETVSGGMAA